MRNKIVKYFSLASLLVFGGCGSSPTNDQGVSFTLTGFYSKVGGGTEAPDGEVGQSVPLSSGELEGAGKFTVDTVAGLRNNIKSQSIRVDRIEMKYYIEGSKSQPPKTMVPLTLLLGPSSGGGSSASSSGSTTAVINSQSYAKFPIVTTDIMSWLNFNRGNLPELPFTMAVEVTAEGISSAGNRYETNPASYFVIFTPDNIIAPTESEF
jgi:hypothetical protein